MQTSQPQLQLFTSSQPGGAVSSYGVQQLNHTSPVRMGKSLQFASPATPQPMPPTVASAETITPVPSPPARATPALGHFMPAQSPAVAPLLRPHAVTHPMPARPPSVAVNILEQFNLSNQGRRPAGHFNLVGGSNTLSV